ncbi:hypothetical protein [Streptomyces antibioticus]|uniref:hypothetical protein n=1 Tax=Streptomyces antibioticus TaxID=1890 RepID=UPI002259B433|nr:hypothetical protein [Streptomyces antibioticus]MCX4742777.1 hypothetical protein [Streptomyces antibioticus]
MSEPNSTAEPPQRDHDELRQLGFEGGTLVAQSKPRFTVDDLKAALFNTTYGSPKTIPVKLPRGRTVQVVITKAEPRYAPNALKMSDEDYKGPPTCYEYPDWYIEGWVADGIASFDAQGLRVRMFVYACGDDSPELDDMYAQVIPTYPMGEIFYVTVSDD